MTQHDELDAPLLLQAATVVSKIPGDNISFDLFKKVQHFLSKDRHETTALENW